MKKKGYRASRKKSSSKKNDHSIRCFRCHSMDNLIAKCPYDSDDEDAIKKERKKQKKKQEKKEGSNKKKGDAHVATWDSDDSSDDERTKKKGHASIAIQGKSSIFETPSCFMAKATKISSDDEGDHASDSDSDDEPTKDEVITMLEDCTHPYKETRKECKALLKDKKTFEQELDELRASYEILKEDHKKLQKAHTKFEEAHSSLVNKYENEPTKMEKAKTCNIGLTYDILSKPIIVASTNPSCSTSTSSSSSSDGFTCDTTLKVENEKELKELNHTLAKAYGGEDRLLMCLCSQRAFLYKEGLGYNPKKGKAAFAPHKTRFVKNNGRYCKACKQVGHLEQQCINKKPKANVSSTKFNSFYELTKDTKGVHAKFIGARWMGSKNKAIWVPKSLVAILGGQNQVWVHKRN